MYDTVKIWHGTQDARSPIRMIRHMAERMPHSTLYEYDELGHFDIHKQLDEVVTELMRQ
jgi:pimeloyl-ACP methyl ester carboxylesterase